MMAAVVAAGLVLSYAPASAARPTTSTGRPCTIVGTPRNDRLAGTARADVICGLGGNDTLAGAGGNDMLDGGAGDDVLTGGAGGDVLIGGAGADTVSYADHGLPVIAKLDGRSGDGSARESDAISADVENLIGGSGNDKLTGSAARNSLRGGPGNDILTGEDGDDTLAGDGGSDVIRGGSGRDTVTYADHTAPVTAKLGGSSGNGSPGESDAIGTDVENLTGGRGSDHLTGDAGPNVLTGGDGDDSVKAGSGDDTLLGQDGNDVLAGESGADTVIGGAGDNICTPDLDDHQTTCHVSLSVAPPPAKVTLSGRVVDADGQPAAGVTVQATRDGFAASSFSATTDAEGQFSLQTDTSASEGVRVWFGGLPGMPQRATITVTTALTSDQDVTITLPRAVRLITHVTGSDGSPLANANVDTGWQTWSSGSRTLWEGGPTYAVDGTPGSGTTDADGNLTLYTFPGTLSSITASYDFGGDLGTGHASLTNTTIPAGESLEITAAVRP